jgi:pilus assembly protein FimV
MIFAFIAIFFALVSETSAQSSNLQIKGPKDAQSQFSGATYGPIDASDTLWRISSRYRQNQALSVYQVMVAIYELNPQAFEQQNLNLLVDGAVLKLPSERYVERVDASKAKQRAQQDDQSLGSKATALQSSKTPNIKPAEELVNKSDLNDTKNQIEQKISQLDDQQIQQFEFLRQQFAASIDNVEALIDENRKVFERLDSVNQDLVDLRTQVDEEVKPQIDQQLELQHRQRGRGVAALRELSLILADLLVA